MQKTKERPRVCRILELLPTELAMEIERIALTRRGGISGIREISLRRFGSSEMNLLGEVIALRCEIDAYGMEILIQKLTKGALYAHRDSIASGYISVGDGIRVGVVGSANYEGGRMVGISAISSLNFRIPTGECAFSEEIYSIYTSGIGAGMLIYSPPGVGKTTALRSLAKSIGGGDNSARVIIVDERGEFPEDDFAGCRVDVLRGYKRREGIEIATRTMSAELIIIDELGADDAMSIVDVVRCGVPIIASVHAASFQELKGKVSLRPLFECSSFDLAVGIEVKGKKYLLRVDKL